MALHEVLETCQICLCDMTRADQLFPLHCPTPKCYFNVCLECIISMLLSEADGYQLASDGSHQLKFRVRCPNCCTKYSLPRRPKQSIVPHVATLRQAYEIRDFMDRVDSSLAPDAYRRKTLFMNYTTLAELKEAVDIYEDYVEMMDKPVEGRLDLSSFLALPRFKVTWSDSSLFPNGEDKYLSEQEQQFLTQLFCSGNPDTVAQGVLSLQSMMKRHSLNTLDESPPDDDDAVTMLPAHEFIARVLCGTNPSLSTCTTSPTVEDSEFTEEDLNSILQPRVVSPVRDLHTMTTQSTFEEPLPEFTASIKPTSFSNDDLLRRMFGVPEEGKTASLSRAYCSFRSMRDRTSSRINGFAPPEPVPADQVNLPLPSRMPRGAEIPVYHPKGWYKPIKFDRTIDTKVVMVSFRGQAKKSGLQTGDVLTHIQSDAVYTYDEYMRKMEQRYTADPNGKVSLVVNADAEVVDHLKTRSILTRLMLRR